MTLLAILLGTVLAGVGSVWLAALLSLAALGRYTQHLLSFAAGALLATAFVDLLPEAFEGGAHPDELFGMLLVGLVFFFLLDKAELWHHGHEHHQDAGVDGDGGNEHAHHHHAHSHVRGGTSAPLGGWAVLAGDGVHAFGDGILIASAFLVDLRLGVVSALAVMAHEVPHHMGDLVVVGRATPTARAALIKVSMAGTLTAAGGLLAYLVLEPLSSALPYLLVAAASSFIYVALADLVPQLQQRQNLRGTLIQIAWLLSGVGVIKLVSLFTHSH